MQHGSPIIWRENHKECPGGRKSQELVHADQNVLTPSINLLWRIASSSTFFACFALLTALAMAEAPPASDPSAPSAANSGRKPARLASGSLVLFGRAVAGELHHPCAGLPCDCHCALVRAVTSQLYSSRLDGCTLYEGPRRCRLYHGELHAILEEQV